MIDVHMSNVVATSEGETPVLELVPRCGRIPLAASTAHRASLPQKPLNRSNTHRKFSENATKKNNKKLSQDKMIDPHAGYY